MTTTPYAFGFSMTSLGDFLSTVDVPKPNQLTEALVGVKKIINGKTVEPVSKDSHQKKLTSLKSLIQNIRLQTPVSHSDLILAVTEASLSPLMNSDIIFLWLREDNEGITVLQPPQSNSWYPPTADDIGKSIKVYCRDAFTYGYESLVESAIIYPNPVLVNIVESSINNDLHAVNKVVVSFVKQFDNQIINKHPETLSFLSRMIDGNVSKVMQPSCQDMQHYIEVDTISMIDITSNGIFIREKNSSQKDHPTADLSDQEVGLYIKPSHNISASCIHPCSLLLTIPLFYSVQEANDLRTKYQESFHFACNDEPLTSITDLKLPVNHNMKSSSSIIDETENNRHNELHPIISWIGDSYEDSELLNGLRDVLSPLVDSKALPTGVGTRCYNTILNIDTDDSISCNAGECKSLPQMTMQLMVSCRDRLSRDALALCVKHMVALHTSAKEEEVEVVDALSPALLSSISEDYCTVQSRLDSLPWRYLSDGNGPTGEGEGDGDLDKEITTAHGAISHQSVPSLGKENSSSSSSFSIVQSSVFDIESQKDQQVSDLIRQLKEQELVISQLRNERLDLMQCTDELNAANNSESIKINTDCKTPCLDAVDPTGLDTYDDDDNCGRFSVKKEHQLKGKQARALVEECDDSDSDNLYNNSFVVELRQKYVNLDEQFKDKLNALDVTNATIERLSSDLEAERKLSASREKTIEHMQAQLDESAISRSSMFDSLQQQRLLVSEIESLSARRVEEAEREREVLQARYDVCIEDHRKVQNQKDILFSENADKALKVGELELLVSQLSRQCIQLESSNQILQQQMMQECSRSDELSDSSNDNSLKSSASTTSDSNGENVSSQEGYSNVKRSPEAMTCLFQKLLADHGVKAISDDESSTPVCDKFIQIYTSSTETSSSDNGNASVTIPPLAIQHIRLEVAALMQMCKYLVDIHSYICDCIEQNKVDWYDANFVLEDKSSHHICNAIGALVMNIPVFSAYLSSTTVSTSFYSHERESVRDKLALCTQSLLNFATATAVATPVMDEDEHSVMDYKSRTKLLEDDLAQLRSDKLTLQESITTLQNDLKRQHFEHEENEAKLKNLLILKTDLEAELQSTQRTAKDVRDEYQQLAVEHEEYEMEISQLKERNRELIDEVTVLKEEVANKVNLCDRMCAESKQSKVEASFTTEQNRMLSGELKVAKEGKKDLQIRLSDMTAKMRQKDLDVETLQSNAQSLQSELQQKTIHISNIEHKLSVLETDVLKMSDERTMLKKQLAQQEVLKNQLAQLRGQLLQAEQAELATKNMLNEGKEENENYLKYKNQVDAEVSTLHEKCQQIERQLLEASNKCEALTTEVLTLEKDKGSLRKENVRLRNSVNKLQVDLDKLTGIESLYEQQLSIMTSKQTRVMELESILLKLTSSHHSHVLDIIHLELKNGHLTHHLLKYKALHNDLGMMYEDLINKFHRISSSCGKFSEANVNLQEELKIARVADPMKIKQLNFLLSKSMGEKNHYQNKAKSLSQDLNRKLLAGTPLQRELGRVMSRLEEVENERNAYRDAMVLACDTFATKETSVSSGSWFDI